jgi:hypothetical protein
MTTRTTRVKKKKDTENTEVNQTLIDLLDSWLAVDEEGAREQRETMQYLRKALDENRPPGYKLFP